MKSLMKNGEDVLDKVIGKLEEWIQIGKLSSEVNRQIVQFLEHNLERVAFMTSAEFATAVGVSQASISRFAGMIGFSGYGEWSKHMQQLIRMELSATQRMWLASNPTFETDEGSEDRVVISEINNLLNINEIVSSDDFEKLVEKIRLAKRVFLISARASATLVPYLHYFLSKVRSGVYSAVAGDTVWERLSVENPSETLIVCIAFPRYPRILLDMIKDLFEQHFEIAAITDHKDSPIKAYSDPVVHVPVTTASLFDSYATPITLFNILVRRIAQLTPEESKIRLDSLEAMDRLHGVYY